jgi:CHAT domain-containing protein
MYTALHLAPDHNDDGRLEVHEIFQLQLKPAYLVALSDCQTNLGGIQRGDEIIGLTRAFIYAGTSGILASLWKVDDYYTEKFMVAFYRALKNADKIEALHTARQTMIRRYGKKHPFYWAAFVLIGDPR